MHVRSTQEGEKEKQDGVEAAIVQALRLGVVKKALRLLCSAPLADKGEETLAALKKLHPTGPEPEPVPSCPGPYWSAEVVGPALCSFGPGSAAGLFGYTPFHLQQCYSAGSWAFSRALVAAVNQLSDGKAPGFLRPFLAGGLHCFEEGATGPASCVWSLGGWWASAFV